MKSGKCSHCSGATSLSNARAVLQDFGRERGNLIPILHALQDRFGYLAAEAMEEVAAWLSIPVSEVYGTATFYALFSTQARGRHIIRVCDGPPCHIEGSKEIIEALTQELGISPGETTADGNFTLDLVSCFGVCGVAPAIMVNDDVHGNLTPETVLEVLGRYRGEDA